MLLVCLLSRNGSHTDRWGDGSNPNSQSVFFGVSRRKITHPASVWSINRTFRKGRGHARSVTMLWGRIGTSLQDVIGMSWTGMYGEEVYTCILTSYFVCIHTVKRFQIATCSIDLQAMSILDLVLLPHTHRHKHTQMHTLLAKPGVDERLWWGPPAPHRWAIWNTSVYSLSQSL